MEHGGHNVMEASAWGVPVVTGPYMFNFTDISRLLVEAGGMEQLDDPAELGAALLSLLDDPPRARAMGEAGRRVVETNRGARDRLLELVGQALA